MIFSWVWVSSVVIPNSGELEIRAEGQSTYFARRCQHVACKKSRTEDRTDSAILDLLSQSINPHGVLVKHLSPVLGAGVLRQQRQGFHPLLEARRQSANRPVAAEHHAIPSETVDHTLDRRLQRLCGPVRQVGVDHNARNLADDVRETGDLPQTLAPFVELAGAGVRTQIRVAAVVEDEVDL